MQELYGVNYKHTFLNYLLVSEQTWENKKKKREYHNIICSKLKLALNRGEFGQQKLKEKNKNI